MSEGHKIEGLGFNSFRCIPCEVSFKSPLQVLKHINHKGIAEKVIENILVLIREGSANVRKATDLLQEHFGPALPKKQGCGWGRRNTRVCRDFINTHRDIDLIKGRLIHACHEVADLMKFDFAELWKGSIEVEIK